MLIYAPISVGELIDKITILGIKTGKISDQKKLENVRLELRQLESILQRKVASSEELRALIQTLVEVNEGLWDIENELRRYEQQDHFPARFVALARSVYLRNDQRAAIKRSINELVGSKIVEEKSYWER